MKATNLLKRQHRQAERLFRQIQRSKDESERVELVSELATALSAHMAIEEQIFYPAAQQVLSGKKALMGETAYLEHMNAKTALQNLLGEGPMSFEARLKVLKELVEHHVKEEEEQLFPELEALIDETEMKSMGTRMQETFEQMEVLGHEEIMAQDMQLMAGRAEGGSKATATSAGQNGGGTKARANGAKTTRSTGRAQARA
ncbi:MAG: hemerythrin domain-containing protein [Polyangiaceae bacterium]|nr:hemerythrin domain-containing protein [Polyangiaceae bacterium]NUQ78305.1 hemerythrin domain-containing protein [Polyangiaceae bacterium]